MPNLAWWLDVKRDLVELTALDRDALHIYAAILILFATVWLCRLNLSDWRGLIPLVVLELLNEFADLRYEIWPPADRGMQWWASAHDIVNTFAVPVLLILVARRYRPNMSAPHPDQDTP